MENPPAPWKENGRPFNLNDKFIHSLSKINKDIRDALFEDARGFMAYLSNFFYRMIPNEHRAVYSYEDIIQEVYLAAVIAHRLYDPTREIAVTSLIGVVARRRIYTLITTLNRQKRKGSAISLDGPAFKETDEELYSVLPDGSTKNPEEIVIEKEALQVIIERCVGLSKLEKKVIELRTEGLQYEEIAQALDKPIKSVDNALQRIKKKFEKPSPVDPEQYKMPTTTDELYAMRKTARKRFDYKPYHKALKDANYPTTTAAMKFAFKRAGLRSNLPGHRIYHIKRHVYKMTGVKMERGRVGRPPAK